MKKLKIPKGTRDFSAKEITQRNYLIKIIKKNFELFGFSPIETPSFEMFSTLNGKYGEEGERLIFNILNSGDFFKNEILKFDKLIKINCKETIQTFIKKYFNSKNILPYISEKTLRYDLTVPFARYVVMNKNKITFPFKRYQIQPVWRADRPQKGRFQEFYQCDADIIGSKSLWQEIEFIQLYDKIFTDLSLPVIIQINHRGILFGLIEILNIKKHAKDFIIILDKWNKISPDKIKEEIYQKGVNLSVLEKLFSILTFNGNFQEKLDKLSNILSSSEKGKKGIKDLYFIYQNWISISSQKDKLELNITLARGLNYYTGIIFEIIPKQHFTNSIGGGGRYDNLTSIFGLKNISGVGISFGLDRIYLAIETLGLFPKINIVNSKILFINFGDEEALYASKIIQVLRNNLISAELYPEAIKLKKQFQYANKKMIPFIAIIGKNEIKKNKIKIKNLKNSIEIEYNNIELFIKDLKF